MSNKKWSGQCFYAAAIAVFGLVVFLATRQYYKDGSSEIRTFQVTASASPSQTIRTADTAESLAALGDSYFGTGRYGEAIGAYRRVLALDPKDADTYNDMGLALHYTGKSEEAVEALKKATSLDPAMQRAWLSLGFILKAIGKHKPSREALEKVIALDPGSAQGIEAKKMLGR